MPNQFNTSTFTFLSFFNFKVLATAEYHASSAKFSDKRRAFTRYSRLLSANAAKTKFLALTPSAKTIDSRYECVITFDNAKKAKVTAREIPLDRILIETDCPYLAPVPFRGQRCDSSMLTYVADAIAEIRGISREEVIKASYDNAIRAYEMESLI